MLRALKSVSFALCFAIPAASMGAQDTETVITLSVGPSFVDFSEVGARFGAAVVRLSVSRDFNRLTGAELSAFALAPVGGMTSTPECPVGGGDCGTRSTPNLLSGALAALRLHAGASGLSASLGGGRVTSFGGEGFDHRSSAAGLVGLDWIPQSNNRFAPTFSVRLLHLSAPIAGARQLLLPGVGLRF